MDDSVYRKMVAKYLETFEIIRTANLVVLLHKKLTKNVLNRWLFMIIPLSCYTLNLVFVIVSDAFWNDEIPLSYVKDMSNSLALSVLYFISYFLSHHFPWLFEEWLNYGISRDYENEIREHYAMSGRQHLFLSFAVGVVLFIIGCMAGLSFCMEAMKNGSKIWINHLYGLAKLYYLLFLGITWYQSLSVLGMALVAGFVIFYCIRDKAIVYKQKEFNKNLSVIKTVDVLLCTFSYGLFYIVGSILFICNDKVAAQKPIEAKNAFDNNIIALCLIIGILMIVCVAYIPLQELIKYMQSEKMKLLLEYDRNITSETTADDEKELLIEKRNELMDQPPILTSMANRILILMSVLIPLIGVVFQGIELYK
uniref:Uncharacterized protein n=1 Tax=Eubacterium plexicaudatum ASF492 TaxID=1235802 RepID=N2AFI0_9FIRM